MNPWKFWQSVFQSMEKFHSENSEKFVANICACFDWISETFCVIWCHLYNFKNVKNTHRRVLLLVKLQAHYLLSPPPWNHQNFRGIEVNELVTSLKVTFLHGCFSCFLNCTNGTKSLKASQIIFLIIIFCQIHPQPQYNQNIWVQFFWAISKNMKVVTWCHLLVQS